MSDKQSELLLRANGIFAFFWLAVRAAVQSITIDEADTYLAYAAPPAPTHWSGSANNQLLNSLLMRLVTSVFGASHLAVRAPALIGAAIYIYACYRLVTAVTSDKVVQWSLYAALIYNPFVMDHLVAARGYSLALGLLFAALALRRNLVAAGLCGALSFTANFSFAVVDLACVAALWLRACRSGERPLRAAMQFVPGALAAAFIAGSVIATWPPGQLVYGASSLGEMLGSLARASLYEINPYFVNPPLRRVLERYGFVLLALVGAGCMWRLPAAKQSRWALPLAAILAATAAVHWLLFRFAHVLLPKDRTAIYFVPLLTLLAGALAAHPGGASRRFLAGALIALATYFFLCLRLTYFKEWKFDADARQVYSVLSDYNRNYGLADIMLNWRYTAVLNFYRAQSGRESLPPFETTLPPYPETRMAYVMFYPDDWPFIRDHGLRIVYHGPLSEAVVAIRPELEDHVAGPACATGE